MIATISWFGVIAGFAGGLALFMFGLSELTDALQRLAGDRLRAVLSRLTINRATGALTGALVTAILQSSTVTTVVAVGFVSAGVLGSVQAISIVLGANVGTTVTAQVISLDINTWALVLVALGVYGVLAARRWQASARVMFGLGLLFIGMQVMAEAMAPLRDNDSVIEALSQLQIPALGVLVGATYTALVRSSSAATALAITLAAQGLIELEAGVAIVIGANVGTCITAVLAAWGRSAAAKRVAAAHVFINIFGALLWIGFIGNLADLSERVSGDLGVARQLANAHTIFNLSVTLVMLPLLGMLVRFVDRLFPDPPPDSLQIPVVSALDSGLLGSPSLALTAARIEIGRLAADLATAVEPATEVAISGSWDQLAGLSRQDDVVDQRYRKIIEYLTKIGQADLSERRTDELFMLISITDDLESLGDVLEQHFVTLGRRRLERSIRLDANAVDRIRELASVVAQRAHDLAHAIAVNDRDTAQQVVDAKDSINTMLARAFVDQAERLVDQGSRDLAPFALERDLLEASRRVYYFTKRAAASQAAGRINDPTRS